MVNDSQSTIEYNKEKHLSTVRGWWEHYYGDTFPDCLPDTGTVALNGESPAAVVYRFTPAGAKIAFIAFMVCDPALTHAARIRLLRAAADGAFKKAKEFLGGQGMIVGITDHPLIAKLYEDNGMFCAPDEKAFFMPVGPKSCDFMKG